MRLLVSSWGKAFTPANNVSESALHKIQKEKEELVSNENKKLICIFNIILQTVFIFTCNVVRVRDNCSKQRPV